MDIKTLAFVSLLPLKRAKLEAEYRRDLQRQFDQAAI